MATAQQLRVAASNVEQARAWDGDEGAYWAAQADRFDRSVAAYHPTFMDAAGIEVGDRVLDVGCGTGVTTRDAARRARRGFALGVDLSSAMLDHARRRAAEERLANVEFVHADAQIHAFARDSFDVVISRTGAMFFGDATAAFRNIASALRPQGRLALLTWQPPPANEWVVALSAALAAGRDRPPPPPEAPGPFALADPDRVRALLAGAGFEDVRLEALQELMWFGDTADEAFDFVLGLLGWMLDGLDVERRSSALSGLREVVTAHDTGAGVVFRSGTWLVTARRS